MADGSERREHERRPATGGAACSVVLPAGERPATLRDVSLAGVGLFLTDPVEAGSVLRVRLTNPARGFDQTVAARVVHVARVDGGFRVGAAFAHMLTFDELADLVT